MKILAIITAICSMSALLALSTPMAVAQTTEVTAKPLTDTDIQLLRSDVQNGKNKVIADTMKFTDAEANAFWPVYKDFSRDQQAIGDDRVKLIKDYAQNFDSMDDTKAKDMAQRLLSVDSRFVDLRKDYWPKFEKALGAKRAAKFYQVDNRLSLIVNLQLASEIPLVQ